MPRSYKTLEKYIHRYGIEQHFRFLELETNQYIYISSSFSQTFNLSGLSKKLIRRSSISISYHGLLLTLVSHDGYQLTGIIPIDIDPRELKHWLCMN